MELTPVERGHFALDLGQYAGERRLGQWTGHSAADPASILDDRLKRLELLGGEGFRPRFQRLVELRKTTR